MLSSSYPALLDRVVLEPNPDVKQCVKQRCGRDVGFDTWVTLPKWWDSPMSGCGDYWTMACDNKCEPRRVRHSCKNPGCPICYADWCKRGGEGVVKRLKGCATAWLNAGFPMPGRPKHVIFSPPQKWAREKIVKRGYHGLNEVYSKLYDVIRECGGVGGVVIDHPFRSHTVEECRDSGFDIDLHFHVVLYSGYMPNSGQFYKKTGWVYKNKGRLMNDESVFNLVFYSLTHRGLWYDTATGDKRKINQAVRYFGKISYNKVGHFKRVSKDVRCCEVCGGEVYQWYHVEYDSSGDIYCFDEADRGSVVMERIVEEHWFIDETKLQTTFDNF